MTEISYASGFLFLVLLLGSCDQNDPPVIHDQDFSVRESSSQYLIARIEARDPEGDQNLSFEIIDGNEEGIFNVNPGSGEITVDKPDLLDYETVRLHLFKVSVSDNHPGDPKVSSAIVRMHVLNNNEITDKLVAYYNFDQDATDQTPNQQHGIVYGAELTEGRNEESQMACLFDGTGDYIRFPDRDLFSYPKGQYSVSLWVQPLSPKDSTMILCKGAGVQDREYALGIGADSLFFFRIHDRGSPLHSQVVFSSTRVNYSDWYHVVATWDGYMIHIYVNKELEGTAFCEATPVNGGSDLFIGTSDGTDPGISYHGLVDDLHIYHKMLAPFEVRNLFRSSTWWWGWS